MKQHITTEQLNQLSKKGQGKLIKWFDPKNLSVKYRGILPRTLSIGEMIEILDENKMMGLGHDEWGDLVIEGVSDPKNLCDALWEAVKGVLENG